MKQPINEPKVWTEEQSDWLIETKARLDALFDRLLAASVDLDFQGIRALRSIPREQRKFVRVPSMGLAAYRAGKVMVLADEALRRVSRRTAAHQALDDLRATIAKMPTEG